MRRNYCYTAVLEKKIIWRFDVVDVEGNIAEDQYWITDPDEYFELRASVEERDYRQGRNQWRDNHQAIISKCQHRINVKGMLDYEEQEMMRAIDMEKLDVQILEDDLPL